MRLKPRYSKLRHLGAKIFEALERRSRDVDQHLLIQSGRLRIGKHSYGNPVLKLFPSSKDMVVIGNFCSIADGVTFVVGGEHRTNWVSTFPLQATFNLPPNVKRHSTSKGDIVVGSDVWIATEAMILSGVQIGHGAVIAARSVVTHDVPPYAIVAGVPAVVKRFRFDEIPYPDYLNYLGGNGRMSR